jgi:hypothetical protein
MDKRRDVSVSIEEAEHMVEALRIRAEATESEACWNLLARLEYFVAFWKAGVEV